MREAWARAPRLCATYSTILTIDGPVTDASATENGGHLTVLSGFRPKQRKPACVARPIGGCHRTWPNGQKQVRTWRL